MSHLFDSALIEYAEDYGFDTLPLAPNSKRAIVRDWQNLAPSEMWEHAPTDANIGLRCGGDSRLAVFDADDKDVPQTSQNLTRYLAGLGLYTGSYPEIATPNNGKHFYLRLDGDLPGHARHYRADIGTGEFRYGRGAYVCAEPSIVAGKAYRLIGGDFRSLARIEVKDVLPILGNQGTATATPYPIATDAPYISRRAWKLLKGEGLDRYHSRSEAEQALLASLANTGNDFDAVLSLFIAYPCGGKFKELCAKNSTNAAKWLRHSFENARRYVETHESHGRQIANAAYAWAVNRVWTGRTGATDRAVFLVCAEIAQRAASVEIALPCRTVAELAQVHWQTARDSLHRLTDANFLVPVKTSTVSLAGVYGLGACCINHSLPTPSNVCKWVDDATSHDAFRARGFSKTFKARGLGKAAQLVYTELLKSDTPLTVAELAERTGRDRSTVWRVLNRMAEKIVDRETGEILSMVKQDDCGKWCAVDGVDLDRIAKALGTFGGGDWQKRKHAKERKEHRERLAEGLRQHKQDPDK